MANKNKFELKFRRKRKEDERQDNEHIVRDVWHLQPTRLAIASYCTSIITPI